MLTGRFKYRLFVDVKRKYANKVAYARWRLHIGHWSAIILEKYNVNVFVYIIIFLTQL